MPTSKILLMTLVLILCISFCLTFTCFKGYIDVFGEATRSKLLFVDYNATADIIIGCGCSDQSNLFVQTSATRTPFLVKYDS